MNYKILSRFWKNNSLVIVLFTVFALTLIGMSIAGYKASNAEHVDRRQPTESYIRYITSGDFVEGVFENWESEFLQMWALVVLTIWLRQKGADDSKPLRGKTPQDTKSRYSWARATTLDKKLRWARHFIYSHSLGMTAFIIFLAAFILHAAGGATVYNQDAEYYGSQDRVNLVTYMGTSQFWYESLQNWQSEFLAVGALMVLSIKLRERGSPESKPVGKRYDRQTGSG